MTRHNIGFEIVDYLSNKEKLTDIGGIQISKKKQFFKKRKKSCAN